MIKSYKIILKSIVVLAVLIFSAISYHSIEEIHYLKTFFPKTFTIEQAFYASGVELIKIIIIAIPVFLIIALCLYSLRRYHE